MPQLAPRRRIGPRSGPRRQGGLEAGFAMLHLNLSVLGRPELERLLEVARARGQEDFVLELEAELRARAAGVTPSAPVHGFAEDEPLPMVVPDAPEDLRFDLPRERSAPRRGHLGLAAAGVLAAGVAFAAWSLGGLPAPSSRPSGELASSRPVTAAPPPAAPAPPPVREAAVPGEPAPRPPQQQIAAARPAEAVARPVQAADTGVAADAVARPRRLDPCANPPTPADRALCGDLALNLLERELRDAYGQALDAGADPGRLRADQAAWRAARDPVSDSRVLARLYDRRIRELREQAVGGSSAEAPENIR